MHFNRISSIVLIAAALMFNQCECKDVKGSLLPKLMSKAMGVNNYFKSANIYMSSVGSIAVKPSLKQEETNSLQSASTSRTTAQLTTFTSTAEPITTQAETTKTTAEPTRTIVEPTRTTAEPTSTTAEPTSTTAEPTTTTVEPTTTTAEPTTTTAEPTTTTAEPTTTTPKPRSCGAQIKGKTVSSEVSAFKKPAPTNVKDCEAACLQILKCRTYSFSVGEGKSCRLFDKEIGMDRIKNSFNQVQFTAFCK